MGETQFWDMSQGHAELPGGQFQAPTPQLSFVVA